MLESVREAFRAALAGNPARLSAKEIAARMAISLSTLYAWGETGEGGKDAPLERLAQFTIITGDARPLVALCRIAGLTCIPLPALKGGQEKASLKAIHEFSEFMQETSQALLDGKVTAQEAARIEKEGNEAMVAISELVQLAQESRAK